MGDAVEKVQEGLKDALADESTSPVDEKVDTKASDTESKGTKSPGPIPYSRFQEVNSKMRELEDTLKTKDSELAGQAKALERLAKDVEAREEAVSYVEQIRNLYRTDPNWKDPLEKLEKRLSGIEDAVEEGTKTPEKAVEATRKALESTKAELEDSIADQRAEMIIQKAELLAEQYLNTLPEQFSSQDKKRIGLIWRESVDWDAVEESKDWNSALNEELPRSLEKVLEAYGEPEGVIVSRLREELGKADDTDKAPTLTPQERLSTLLNRNWGESNLKTSDTGRPTSFDPKVSDADFAAAAAETLRLTRAIEEAEFEARKAKA